jgi:hypothetical protein
LKPTTPFEFSFWCSSQLWHYIDRGEEAFMACNRDLLMICRQWKTGWFFAGLYIFQGCTQKQSPPLATPSLNIEATEEVMSVKKEEAPVADMDAVPPAFVPGLRWGETLGVRFQFFDHCHAVLGKFRDETPTLVHSEADLLDQARCKPGVESGVDFATHSMLLFVADYRRGITHQFSIAGGSGTQIDMRYAIRRSCGGMPPPNEARRCANPPKGVFTCGSGGMAILIPHETLTTALPGVQPEDIELHVVPIQTTPCPSNIP